jgi:hypothetical protein
MALEYAQRCDSGYVLVCVVVGWAGLCAWGWRGWALNGAAGCLQGVALANCDVGISSSDKSDPYLKFLAMSKDAKPSEAKATKDSKPVKVYTVEVHKTEVVQDNLNPVWMPFTIDIDKLCNGDKDIEKVTVDTDKDGKCVREIRRQVDVHAKFMIECWDKDSLTSDDEIGWVETTIAQLLTMEPLALIDRPKGNRDKPGVLEITSIEIEVAGPKPGGGASA